MGSGMARRIASRGYPLTVYNRDSRKARALDLSSVTIVGTPAEAAAQGDVVISMVADDGASRAVWIGAHGALAGAKPGTLCLECSTVTVDWVLELATAAQKAGHSFLDAPVTGSRAQAESGELNFLVGGSAATLAAARPVLAAMGKTIVHLGPTGSGARVKLVNNFVCGVQVAALAEAIVVLERSGIPLERALGALTGGAPGSPLVRAVAERILAGHHAPNFVVRLMAKDLGYAIADAERYAVTLTTAAAALHRFERSIAEGHGDRDIAAIVESLRRV